MALTIRAKPGTYILLIKVPHQTDVKIGRRRQTTLNKGLYGYVGSALGPGGLVARLRHHATPRQRKHWHSDYLWAHAQLIGVLLHEGTERLECQWAAWVAHRANECVVGFGASDCRCRGHLFHLGAMSMKETLIELAETELQTHYWPHQQLRF